MAPTLWGIHMGKHVGSQPQDQGYVAIGSDGLGDLRNYPTRETIKAALLAKDPSIKPASSRVIAGIAYRFAHEIKTGDLVVYPSKHDRRVNIGRFVGGQAYIPDDQAGYQNHRGVEWLGDFARDEFSQSTLNEIGAYITIFKVKEAAGGELLAKVGIVAPVGPPLAEPEEPADDEAATQAIAAQAEQTTEDFVVKRIIEGLSHYDFEEFVAHLLRCMGYTARVTPMSGDGGVDVIAHMDALGFQPPIVKVQCKHTTAQIGLPQANQLLGTLGEGEFGLFICLGSYSKPAKDMERNKAKLRLIDGEEFVEMVLANYDRLAPRYRTLAPLKQIYVPDLPKA